MRNRQIDRYTDKYIDIQIDRQIDRKIDRQKDRQIDRYTDHKGSKIERYLWTSEKGKEGEKIQFCSILKLAFPPFP